MRVRRVVGTRTVTLIGTVPREAVQGRRRSYRTTPRSRPFPPRRQSCRRQARAGRHGAVRRPIFRTFHHARLRRPAAGRAEGAPGPRRLACACPPATRRPPSARSSSCSGATSSTGAASSTRSSSSTTTPPTRTAEIAADAGARVVGGRRRAPRARSRRGQGRGALEVGGRRRGRPHRVVRRRHPRLRRPTSWSACVGPLLARADIGFVKGFYDRPVEGSAARRRAGHRADGPARDRRAVPAPGRRSCSRCRASTPAAARCSSGCRSCRATASTSGCSSTSPSCEGTEAIAQVDLGTAPPPQPPARRARPAGARRAADGARPRRRRPATSRPRSCARISSPSRSAIGERPPLVEVSGYRRRTA